MSGTAQGSSKNTQLRIKSLRPACICAHARLGVIRRVPSSPAHLGTRHLRRQRFSRTRIRCELRKRHGSSSTETTFMCTDTARWAPQRQKHAGRSTLSFHLFLLVLTEPVYATLGTVETVKCRKDRQHNIVKIIALNQALVAMPSLSALCLSDTVCVGALTVRAVKSVA